MSNRYSLDGPMKSFFETTQNLQSMKQNQNTLERQAFEMAELNQQKAAQQKEADFISKFKGLYESGDMTGVQGLIGSNIDVRDKLRNSAYESMGLVNAAKQEEYKSNIMRLATQPDNAESIINEQIAIKQSNGEDVTKEIAAIELLKSDPSAFHKKVKDTAIFEFGDDVQKFNEISSFGQMSPRDSAIHDLNVRKQNSQESKFNAEQRNATDKLNLELKKLKMKPAGGSLKLSDRTSLIKNRQDIEKPARKAQGSANRIVNLLNSESMTGQEATAAIIDFAKSFDPDSVVTEGEQVIYSGGNGVIEDMFSSVSKVGGNTRLTSEVKKGLLRGSKIAANEQIKIANETLDTTGSAYRGAVPDNDYKVIFSDSRLTPFEIDNETLGNDSLFRSAPTVEESARRAQAGEPSKVNSVMAKYGF